MFGECGVHVYIKRIISRYKRITESRGPQGPKGNTSSGVQRADPVVTP